jgi:hypothetical protein
MIVESVTGITAAAVEHHGGQQLAKQPDAALSLGQ